MRDVLPSAAPTARLRWTGRYGAVGDDTTDGSPLALDEVAFGIAEGWGNGARTTNPLGTFYRSNCCMFVGDTNADRLWIEATLAGGAIDASNERLFSFGIGRGAPGATKWSAIDAAPIAQRVAGQVYQRQTYGPFTIGGTPGSMRRVFLLSPYQSGGINLGIDGVSFDPGVSWTTIAEPGSGPLVASQALGGALLGTTYGYSSTNGSTLRMDGGYPAARTSTLAELAAMGAAAGLIVLFTPTTNDFTAGVTPANIQAAVAGLIADLKSNFPSAKIAYMTMLLRSGEGADTIAFRAAEATGAAGADLVVDGSTVGAQGFVLADLCDGLHPYLSTGVPKLLAEVAAMRTATGTAGQHVTFACANSIGGGAAQYSNLDSRWIQVAAEGLVEQVRLA